MTNKPKAKGTSWETEVTGYLNDGVFPFEFERVGSRDYGAGDIHGGEWVIEAKSEAQIDLPGYLKQLKGEVERNDFEPIKAFVAVKNRRHSAGDGYAVMSLENMRLHMAYVEALEGLLRVFSGVIDLLSEDNEVNASGSDVGLHS